MEAAPIHAARTWAPDTGDGLSIPVITAAVVLVVGTTVLASCYSMTFAAWAAMGSLILLSGLKPHNLFVLFLLLFPVHSVYLSADGVPKSDLFFSDLLLLSCMMAMIIHAMIHQNRVVDPNPSTPFLFLFWGFAALSILWTSNTVHGYFVAFKILICMGCFYSTIYLMRRKPYFLFSLKWFIAITVILACVSIVSTIITTGWDFDIQIPGPLTLHIKFWKKHIETGGRVSMRGVAFSVPHDTAHYCNMGIFFAVAMAYIAKTRRALTGYIALAVFIGCGMLSTLTKSTIAAMWAGLAVTFLLTRPLKKWFFTLMVVLVVTTLALFFFVRIHRIVSSVNYTQHQMDSTKKGSSLGARSTLWKLGAQYLVSSGGIGYGAGGLSRKVDMPVPDGTHPAVLFDFGFLGFFLWVMVFVQGFFYFIRYLLDSANEEGRRIMAVYMGGFVMMMISWMVTLEYDYVDLYFYLGLGYALTYAFNDRTDSGKGSVAENHPESRIRIPLRGSH